MLPVIKKVSRRGGMPYEYGGKLQSWVAANAPQPISVPRAEILSAARRGLGSQGILDKNALQVLFSRVERMFSEHESYVLAWEYRIIRGGVCRWTLIEGSEGSADIRFAGDCGRWVCQYRQIQDVYEVPLPEPVCNAPWPIWCKLEWDRDLDADDGYTRSWISSPTLFASEILEALLKGGVPPWLGGNDHIFRVSARTSSPREVEAEILRFGSTNLGVQDVECYRSALANARSVNTRRAAERKLRLRLAAALKDTETVPLGRAYGRVYARAAQEALRVLGVAPSEEALRQWLKGWLTPARLAAAQQ